MTMLKYVKRTCKSSRQELLNKVLEQELECLRKRCFPYKKRSFIKKEIEIKEHIFNDTTTTGQYIESKDKHLILIKKNIIYGCQKNPLRYYRKKYIQQLRQTIKHELIHAFTLEYFGNKTEIENIHFDASPIFLAVLSFVDGDSGHDCFLKYVESGIWHHFNRILKFETLEKEIIEMLNKYQETIDKIKEIQIIDKKNKERVNMIMETNKFEFESRKPGLILKHKIVNKAIFTLVENKNVLGKNNITYNFWSIGCNVLPSKLEELYNRKNFNESEEKFEFEKKLYIISENKKDFKKIIPIREIKTVNV